MHKLLFGLASSYNFLQHKEQLNDLCERLTLTPFTLADLQYLDSYKLLMTPIAQALDFLQGEENIGYGCILPSLMTLTNKLKKLDTQLEPPLDVVAFKLIKQLKSRFQKFFDLSEEANFAIAAAALNPCVKLEWVRVLQKISPEVTTTEVTQKVLSFITDFAVAENIIPTGDDIVVKEKPRKTMYFDFSDDEQQCVLSPSKSSINNENNLQSLISSELLQYLNDKEVGPGIWEKYELLKVISLALNTPLTSSGPVERLFSFAGIVNSPRRGSLADFSLEKLVLLKANNPR